MTNSPVDKSNINFWYFFSWSYLYLNSSSSFNPIDLDQNIAKDIIIPLTYTQKEFVDHLGLLIELDYNGSTYYQIINPYLLFTTSNIDYAIYEYEIINNWTE